MSVALARLAGFIWATLKVLPVMILYAPLMVRLLNLHLRFGLPRLAATAPYTLAPPARPLLRSTPLNAHTLGLLLGPLLLLYLISSTANPRSWS